LRAFQSWREGVTSRFSEGEDITLALSLVHAVGWLQQWRLNVSDAHCLRRLEEALEATERMTETLMPSLRAHRRHMKTLGFRPRTSSGRWFHVPNMVFGVRRPDTKV